MGWYKKAKRKVSRSKYVRKTPHYKAYRRVRNSRVGKWNRKHGVVGLHYNNWISPIDVTPVGWVSKGNKAYKAGRTGYRLSKAGFSGYGRKAYNNAARHAADSAASIGNKARGKYKSKKKSSRRTSSPNRRTSQSRRGGSSRYYYYKGKRYERKYKR